MAVPNGMGGGDMKGYKKKRKSVVTATKSVTTVSAPSRPLEIHIPPKFLPKEPIILDGNKYVPAFSTSTVYTPWGYVVE